MCVCVCVQDWDSRDDDDTVMIERVILLVRNVLHVPPDQNEEKVSCNLLSTLAGGREGRKLVNIAVGG